MKVIIGNILLLHLSVISHTSFSQTPGQGLGRTMSENEVSALMYSVGPEGKELPPGQGTARKGAEIYNKECIFCHGPQGLNGPQNTLKGKPMFPFATSIWDYIHRAMPRSLSNVGVQARQLSNDETYALTAYLLYINGIVEEDEAMNKDTLPKVNIPIEKAE